MSDNKKDLTKLSDLPPPEEEPQKKEEDAFGGIAPFSFEDALAELPPLDSEILKTAQGDGGNASLPPMDSSEFPTTDSPGSTNDGFPTTEPSTQASGSDFEPLFPVSASDSPPTETSADAPLPNADFNSDLFKSFDAPGSSTESPAAAASSSDGNSGLIVKPLEPTSGSTPDPKNAPAVSAIRDGLDKIKNYSDRMTPTGTTVPAGIPFSVVIEGELKVHEKERLLEIISREQLSVREVEIEPQLAAGKILIPRISEYAGVLIAQALRNSNARIRLGPTDKIFQSKELLDDDSLLFPRSPNYVRKEENHAHAADEMTLSSAAEVPGHKVAKILDTFEVSTNLRALHVHSSNSTFFQESLEGLKKQLRLRAHHKGADALIRFKTELFPLDDQSQYKLLATAIAVKLQAN